MNLHDWIDELSDALDLETEVDEGLLSELAELAHDNVDPEAGPVTTYLLGYAAATRRAGPATVERLAAAATELAESWDKPADVRDRDDVDDDLADGSDLGGDLGSDLGGDLDEDDDE